jgi:transcriptional regulator GlxA family with amidase domain
LLPDQCAFDELGEQLKAASDAAPQLTEGLRLWMLGYTACNKAHRPAQDGTKRSGGLAPWQLRRATDIYEANLMEKHLVEQVAAACKVSPSHFGRAFKQSTGLSPHQWVLSARVRSACDLLLNSPKPLAEIAITCGFADQGHFTRTFRRLQGTSPGAWRRHHRI